MTDHDLAPLARSSPDCLPMRTLPATICYLSVVSSFILIFTRIHIQGRVRHELLYFAAAVSLRLARPDLVDLPKYSFVVGWIMHSSLRQSDIASSEASSAHHETSKLTCLASSRRTYLTWPTAQKYIGPSAAERESQIPLVPLVHPQEQSGFHIRKKMILEKPSWKMTPFR